VSSTTMVAFLVLTATVVLDHHRDAHHRRDQTQ
jgi:hypothetical protein